MIDITILYILFCLWTAFIYGLSYLFSRHHCLSAPVYKSLIMIALLPFVVFMLVKLGGYNPVPAVKSDIITIIVLGMAIEDSHVLSSKYIGFHLGFWSVYVFIAAGLITQVLGSIIRLWRLGPVKDGMIVLESISDPACLPWPRRAILLPAGLDGKTRDYVLAHERAHQKYYDAEMTLTLCLLGAVFWLNYPLARLIKQWRFAIELRADAQVLNGAPRTHRKDYAALLLRHIAAQNGPHKNRHEGARPCPSMALIPDQKRRTEMRLKAILNVNADKRKPRWAARLMTTGLCAAGLGGGIGLSALAADDAPSAGDQNQALLVTLIKRVPPVFPLNCIPKENPPVVKTSTSGREIHGWVKLRFNVDKDGVPYDIKAFESSKSCFEASSIASVREWRYVPGQKVAGVENMLFFIQIPD